MSNTPSLTPPLVTSGVARLLIHENVLAAVFTGYKKARPELFISGSFNVPSPAPPIALSKPGGGTSYIQYRIELTSFGFDIVPADQQFGTTADPFNLSSDQAALYSEITFELGGEHPAPWSDQIILSAWLKLELEPVAGGLLVFAIRDVLVFADGVSNSSLLHMLNMVLADYLDSAVLQIKAPLNIPVGELGTLQVNDVLLHLNSIDAHASFI